MSLDPSLLRYMTPSQIATALTIDDAITRSRQAATAGHRCAPCGDSGMEGGRFCSCDRGRKLAGQSFTAPSPNPSPSHRQGGET